MTEIELEEEKKAIAREYKELLRISYQTLTDTDKKVIRKAFDVAVDAHKAEIKTQVLARRLGQKCLKDPANNSVSVSRHSLDAHADVTTAPTLPRRDSGCRANR